jgi:hypothetical protein
VDHSQHTGGAKPEAKGQPASSQPAASTPSKKALNMDDMKM